MQKLWEIQTLVFINKVWLGRSHTYLFIYIVYGCLGATVAERNLCNREVVTAKLQIFTT